MTVFAVSLSSCDPVCGLHGLEPTHSPSPHLAVFGDIFRPWLFKALENRPGDFGHVEFSGIDSFTHPISFFFFLIMVKKYMYITKSTIFTILRV